MLGKVATEDNLSDTSRNIFSLDESRVELNNKPDTIITENVSSVSVSVKVRQEWKHDSDSVLYCCSSISATSSNIQGSQQDTKSSVKGYPQGQVYTRNGNRRILARAYSSSGSQGISSIIMLQGRSLYLQMATELIAAPLYCFRLLLKIMSLSYVYRVNVLLPYSLWITAFLGL